MFAGIAGRYDAANHLLSGGLDFGWRARLTKLVAAEEPATVVDLATGSGDVAFAIDDRLDSKARVIAMDFCQPMLDEAERKRVKRGVGEQVTFQQGDCLALPLEDGVADVVTIAFGLRNLEDRAQGLREMLRILRPGGVLLILEFTQPDAWFKPFYFVYLKAVLPIIAAVVTGKRDAYEYLAGSIEAFPTKAAISAEIADAGFADISATGLTFSSVAIHRAVRKYSS